MKNKYPLDSLENIRTALRKRTVQTAIYKNQAETGARQTDELLAYIGFMTEDECMAFLNSVRKAPFIPNINLMWTQQVIEYLMLTDADVVRKYYVYTGAENLVKDRCKDGSLSYDTKYVQQHVDKEYWHMLPKGWSAKYYNASQILRLAVSCANCVALNDFCKYIAEKLFIKAADLEDCLSPVTKLPPALPELPKVAKVKTKNEIVLKDFPEGTHISIDVPKPNQQVVPKVDEAPKKRGNPIATVVPMFAAQEAEATKPDKQCYYHSGHPRSFRLTKQRREELIQAIKTRLLQFGGKDGAIALAKEFGVCDGTIYFYARMIRANMAASTN